jgi:hypothetical protein
LEQDRKEWLKDGMTWAQIQQIAINASGTNEEYVSPLGYDTQTLTSKQVPDLPHQRGRPVYRRGREGANHCGHGVDWHLILGASYYCRRKTSPHTLCETREADELWTWRTRLGHAPAQVCCRVVRWQHGIWHDVSSCFAHANFTCRKPSRSPLSFSVIQMTILVWPSQSVLHVESPLSY